jgi:4-alpha-glucanotransferase
LPQGHGSGDIGPAAHQFVSFLADAGQRYWQMLPICPPGHGYSPYDSPSSFAISPTLLSIEYLAETGLLSFDELPSPVTIPAQRRADFDAAVTLKDIALKHAYARFVSATNQTNQSDFEAFRNENREWLDDHALFVALKDSQPGKCWTAWDEDIRDRKPHAIERVRRELKDVIGLHEFTQFELHRQWKRLKERCRDANVLLIGDVPIYVSHDSADVWANRDVFCLANDGTREVVAGVPPDYFSSTGQLWGNPLYRWPVLQRKQFEWWIARLRTCLQRFDAVRLDHFIGFRRYWEVPATAKTAEQGRYVDVPGEKFFSKVLKELGSLPFIAEDLGVVTAEVTALRHRFSLPGMKILQFAFDDPSGSDYLPHRYESNTTVYTGTHDNDTSVGWFHASPPQDENGRSWHDGVRARVRRYLDGDIESIHWKLIKLAISSVAMTAIVPVQDLLGLGSEARMNTPGTTEDNWSFRLLDNELTADIASRLRSLCETYERFGR